MAFVLGNGVTEPRFKLMKNIYTLTIIGLLAFAMGGAILFL